MDLHWNYAGHFAKSERDPNYADLLTPRYYGLTLCVTRRISLDEVQGVFPAEFNWSSADGLAFRGEEGHLVIDVLRLTDRSLSLLRLIIQTLGLSVVNRYGKFIPESDIGKSDIP